MKMIETIDAPIGSEASFQRQLPSATTSGQYITIQRGNSSALSHTHYLWERMLFLDQMQGALYGKTLN